MVRVKVNEIHLESVQHGFELFDKDGGHQHTFGDLVEKIFTRYFLIMISTVATTC